MQSKRDEEKNEVEKKSSFVIGALGIHRHFRMKDVRTIKNVISIFPFMWKGVALRISHIRRLSSTNKIATQKANGQKK